MKEIDIEFIKRMGIRANVIPVISKADTLTPDELQLFKSALRRDISYFELPIYDFPFAEDDEPEMIQEAKELQVFFLLFSVNLSTGYASSIGYWCRYKFETCWFWW